MEDAQTPEVVPVQKRGREDEADSPADPPSKKPSTKERQRVSRACDTCKRKKSRCTGTLPCPACERSKLWCTYDVAYTRGKHPPTPPTKSPATGSFATTLTPAIVNHASRTDDELFTATIQPSAPESQTTIDTRIPANDPQTHIPRSPSAKTATQFQVQDDRVPMMPVKRNSPIPTHTDSQGHYVGSSSGIAFLSRARNRLRRRLAPTNQDIASSGSIFSFGDAPLPDCDAAGFMLPSVDEVTGLIARYFEYSMPTHRFLHLGTVVEWQKQFFDNPQRCLQDESSKSKNAVLFMVLAIAKASDDNADGKSGKFDGSFQYYQAAERQLQGETGRIRLASVQARLCQCFYLLSQSCVNRAWNLFGTVTRLIHALGLHRKAVADVHIEDMVERECRKRTFWCAYVLDRYLGSMLGRPCALHDGDIDQDMPEAIDDKDLHMMNSADLGRNRQIQTAMHACIAHMQLARILSEILQTQYGLRPLDKEVQNQATQRFRLELNNWMDSLPAYLSPAKLNPDSLPLLWQRQSTTLRLALSHARILAFRPFVVEYDACGPWSILEPMANCVDAALTAIDTVESLVKHQQLQNSFWFSQYVGFSASVVLYTHYNSGASSSHLPAAARCAAHLRSIATPNSLCQRYTSVIDALQAEPRVDKQSAIKSRPSGGAIKLSGPSRATEVENDTASREVFPTYPYSASPVVLAPDCTIQRSAVSRAVDTASDASFSADLQFTDDYWNTLVNANIGEAGVTNWMDFDSFVLDPMHFE